MQPYDEPDIGDVDKVIRRIHPIYHIVDDENRGCKRISSKAFHPSSNPPGGMSVDVEKLILGAGIDPVEFVTANKFNCAVYFTANVVRNLGLRIGYEPILNHEYIPDNPYHGEVWGASEKPFKFTTFQKKGLHRAASWYVEISGISII